MIGKAAFGAATQAQSSQGPVHFDGTSEIQEIKLSFMWTNLTVVATPPGGAASMTRAGHTLSILKKQDDKWVLARDANMLAPVSEPGNEADCRIVADLLKAQRRRVHSIWSVHQ